MLAASLYFYGIVLGGIFSHFRDRSLTPAE
jgi:hypothetical protein